MRGQVKRFICHLLYEVDGHILASEIAEKLKTERSSLFIGKQSSPSAYVISKFLRLLWQHNIVQRQQTKLSNGFTTFMYKLESGYWTLSSIEQELGEL